MADNQKCSVCGKKLGNKFFPIQFGDRVINVCDGCHIMLNNVKSTDTNKKNEALHYLHICSSAGTVSSEAAPFINPIIEETTVSQKTIQQEKNTQIPTKKELVSQAGLNIAGFCFLLQALILYIISVNNNYGVANIQATVFSAAAFVAGMISIIGAKIIKAINATCDE